MKFKHIFKKWWFWVIFAIGIVKMLFFDNDFYLDSSPLFNLIILIASILGTLLGTMLYAIPIWLLINLKEKLMKKKKNKNG